MIDRSGLVALQRLDQIYVELAIFTGRGVVAILKKLAKIMSPGGHAGDGEGSGQDNVPMVAILLLGQVVVLPWLVAV